tara:strand:- start:656 stop:1936 length:1281 start_codon:yes stop_codon:yes gene_type:complete
MSASTQRLNYSQVPPRASSSRAIRNEITPTNGGGSYTMNSQIIFDLPANLNNTFCDFQSSYIKATINNGDGAAVKLHGGGFPSCIKQIVLELGGQNLFSCDNWNTLYEMMLTLDTSASFRNNAGNRLFGAGGDFDGASIAAGASLGVCFPLVLTPLMCNRYFPLVGRDRLRIRLILDTSARSLLGAATDSEVTITDVALVTYNLELGSDIMNMVAANSGGAFKIAMPSYQHHQASLSNSATSLVATLGFSMSSLNRVLIAQTQQAAVAANNHIGNRSRLRLNRFFITIGGVKYPMRDVQDLGVASTATGAGAEPLAEALISQRALCAWTHDSSVEADGGFAILEGTGATSGTTGAFLIDLDLESQRTAGGESSVGLVAGVNCIGQVCQLTMEYAAAPTANHVVDVFGEHTILCSLDLNTLTWSIAV